MIADRIFQFAMIVGLGSGVPLLCWHLLQIYRQLIKIEMVLMEFHISYMMVHAKTQAEMKDIIDKYYETPNTDPYGNVISKRRH